MYQQPLDITIGEDERVFFKVSGTHTIYLTGNFVMPVDDTHNHMGDDSEEDEYDLSPDEDELDLLNEEESDDLDNMEDPRLVEVESEEEEAPKLVKKGKGKNKRAAEESEEEAGLDEIMTKALKKGSEAATNGEAKLSKKQLKKLKNNAGEAAAAALENKNVKKVDATSSDSPNKEKKVQFAKNLEQGPTGKDVKAPKDAKMNGDKGARKADEAKPKVDKTDNKADSAHGKTILGVKTIQGVTLDDRKIGTGPAAKKGAKVGLRYIGKTDDGKQFDGKFSISARNNHLLIEYSKQKRQAIHLHSRRRRSHQGLGYRRGGHVCWRRAPSHHPCESRLRQQGPPWHPEELEAHIRHKGTSHRLTMMFCASAEKSNCLY